MCFAEEENSYHRKAVISASDDISKRNIASELSSGASTVVKHCSRAYIAIKQYLGVPPLPKLEVLPNFRVAQQVEFLERFEAKLLQVCEL